MRSAFEKQLPTSAPPESLSESNWAPQARECLGALGFEAPTGEWEAFEGWPDGSG